MDPEDDTDPTLCLELSGAGAADGWRYGLSRVWPRGRIGGLAGGLEDALSRELGKWSLKTIPCRRAVLEELDMALPGTFGIDLGEELRGDIGPRA